MLRLEFDGGKRRHYKLQCNKNYSEKAKLGTIQKSRLKITKSKKYALTRVKFCN